MTLPGSELGLKINRKYVKMISLELLEQVEGGPNVKHVLFTIIKSDMNN